MERRLTKRSQAEAKKGVHNCKLKGGEMNKKCRESDLEWSQSEREQRARLGRRPGLVLDWQVRVQDLTSTDVTHKTRGRSDVYSRHR